MTNPSIDNHIHESLLSFHSFPALYPLSPACTSDSDQLLFKVELTLCVNSHNFIFREIVLWWCMGKRLWCVVPLFGGSNPCGVGFFNIVILHPFYLVNNQLYNVPIIESIFGDLVPIIHSIIQYQTALF